MLSTNDIVKVTVYYDIGQLCSWTAAHRGLVNETAFAQTTQGRFVVRRNHRGSSIDQHVYRHNLMYYLQERGLPVPTPLPNRLGTTLLEIHGRSYEVMPFVAGEPYEPNHPEQLVSVGSTLARYHQTVLYWQAPPRSTPPRYCPQNLLALNENIIEQDVMGDLLNMTTWYDREAARLRRNLSSEAYQALPHLTIHGDIHSDNFLFAQDEVAALLDFDQIAWDTPVADLADALVGFASIDKPQSVTSWGVFNGPLDAARAEQVLRGYASVRKLSDTEMKALPDILEVLWLQAEIGRVMSTPEADPAYHLSVLAQGAQLSDWLATRRDELTERWAEIMRTTELVDEPLATAA